MYVISVMLRIELNILKTLLFLRIGQDAGLKWLFS